MASLTQLTAYLDDFLDVPNVPDWPQALNGLQLENSGAVGKIGAAVDACEPVIIASVQSGVQLLLVHHGLFWPGAQPIRGAAYRKMKTALDHDLAIYSAHLPLDVHPRVGNNVLLCRALGLKKTEPFFPEKGIMVGLKADAPQSRPQLFKKLEKVLGGPVHLSPGGPERVQKIGVVTGGAGGEIVRAAQAGIDTFITGEGPHHSYLLAEELGVNLFYGGHYATETFGVKALAAHLSKRFQLPWEFLDHPTGL